MRWLFPAEDLPVAELLQRELRLLPLTARLLAARGFRTAEEAQLFLSPRLADLHSPYQMLGMKTAVERVEAAIARKEKVLIYGDYDVDGTVAIVILKTAIELCGGTAGFHVPHRIREGYGMRDEVIERAATEGVRVIISVDTGIRAFAAAQTARRLGVDLILTDHHLPQESEGVPPALAVLNPNQPGCGYPCKALCGAGVAFKLAQALLDRAGRGNLLPSFLKMVAIATIADAVALTGENRLFARLGLEGLRRPVNVGLKALLEVSGVVGRKLTAADIGFRVGPRLNAAGRMDVAADVIDLFLTREEGRAREIAEKLNRLNGERQQEEARIIAEAIEQVESQPELQQAWCVVAAGEGWHRGVVGIVATRLVERYNRPALVLSCEDGEAQGSGRSIPNFHLLQALESCHELFTRYGGHAHAVGLSLPVERVPHLRQALDCAAHSCLTAQDFEPTLEVDGELRLEDLTPQLYSELEYLEPFGLENPEPVFVIRDLRLVAPPQLLKEKHIKLRLVQDSGGRTMKAMDALAWRMAEQVGRLELLSGDRVAVAFTLDRDDHPELERLQMVVRDLRRAQPSAASQPAG